MQSREDEQLRALYRGWTDTLASNPAMALEDMRELFDHWGDVTAEPADVDFVEDDADGILILWARPRDANMGRALLCFHGGGFVVGSTHSHRKMFGHLARATRCPAAIVHYARAPEHPHPGPVNDAVKAYQWLLKRGVAAGAIGLTGDSAGGALAVAMTIAARDRGLPLPAAAAVMSPFFDLEARGDSFERNAATDLLVSRPIIQAMTGMFVGPDGNPRDPLACPLYADLAGLPPIYIQASDAETLQDGSHDFVDRARKAGVDVALDLYEGEQHVFQMLAGTTATATAAVERMGRWLESKLA